jgi:hypothetical protein
MAPVRLRQHPDIFAPGKRAVGDPVYSHSITTPMHIGRTGEANELC